MTRTCHLLLIAAVVSLVPALHAGESEAFSKLLADKSPAIVSIKFVLKISGGAMFGGGDQESESEVNGVLIDAKGLVLCSNTQLAGFVGMMKQFMGPMGAQMSATPTDIKVLVGDDSEGKEAEIIARDTELDLAWVRIKTPGEHPFPFVDFSQSGSAKVGEEVYALRRMGKYFARTTVAGEGRIAGTTVKPRELMVPSGTVGASYGMPVFNTEGKPIGVVVMQVPESEGSDANPMALLGRMSGMQDMMNGFILPAAQVVKATKRALETTAPK